MSDEESFVILGSSPTPSLTQEPKWTVDGGSFRSLDQSTRELMSRELTRSEQIWSLNNSVTPTNGEATSPKQHNDSIADNGKKENTQISDESKTAESSKQQESGFVGCEPTQSEIQLWSLSSSGQHKNNEATPTQGHDLIANDNRNENPEQPKLGINNSSTSSSNTSGSSSLGVTSKGSLAASFILGEVNADVLKTSVYSQFPSICSMEACAEDVVKLQNLMSEYVELKNTLTKVNTTMKQFYQKTQQWKDDMHRSEQNYQLQLEECQRQILMLRDENVELSRDLNNKMNQISITESLRKKDYDELVQSVSEKKAIIENMRVQIAKLEQQQLVSFEGIPKNITKDSKEKPYYIDRIEHERIVKDFQHQLSELLAQNLDLQDVQKQYIDEISCLKVNLAAAEELMKQHKSEINLLKIQKMKDSEEFDKFRTERAQIKEELALLSQQLDVYKHDFEVERVSRQNLAGEKDQLLQDLRMLQRKNHELIEEAQRQYEAMEEQRAQVASAKPSAKVSSSPSENAECPICSKVFKNLDILQSHVNDCLDKN